MRSEETLTVEKILSLTYLGRAFLTHSAEI